VALFLSSFFLEKNEAKLANAVHEVKTSLEKNRRGSRIAIAYEGVRHDKTHYSCD